MNRAERRRQERKYGKVVAMQRYRDEAFELGRQCGQREDLEVILYMTAYTIQYKLGFGEKRLTNIMYHIMDNIDAFKTGHLTPNDFKEIKQEINKLGIKF